MRSANRVTELLTASAISRVPRDAPPPAAPSSGLSPAHSGSLRLAAPKVFKWIQKGTLLEIAELPPSLFRRSKNCSPADQLYLFSIKYATLNNCSIQYTGNIYLTRP
jgi:hypothetical protein